MLRAPVPYAPSQIGPGEIKAARAPRNAPQSCSVAQLWSPSPQLLEPGGGGGVGCVEGGGVATGAQQGVGERKNVRGGV